MKTVKKFVWGLLAFIIIAIIFALFFIHNLRNRAIPDYDNQKFVAGLQQEVTVYRDSLGIPHIYAKNEHDLYLVTGYIMAEERLWQMDLLRRVTTGRLSEIFGKDFVETDLLLRALDYPKKSKWVLDSCDQNTINAMKSFAQGVNNYIVDAGKKLPPEFTILGYRPEPWEIIHSVNLIGYMAWDLEAGWSPFVLNKLRPKIDSVRWLQLLPHIQERETVVYPEFAFEYPNVTASLLDGNRKLVDLGLNIFSGSNNWSVGGSKTRSGSPVLANDMHIGLNMPGIWMQVHQHVEPTGLHVTGVALPGQPFIICGHNDSIAWGMTNAFVDNVDFYEEKFNEDSTKYLYNEKWYDVEQRAETINLKDGTEIKKTIMFTHRGPVINRFKEYEKSIVTMHWVGHEYSNEMQTIYLLNRAANWNDFLNAMRTFKSISQNINYADKKGNIGLFYAAGIPIRKRSPDYHILPGWSNEYDWVGFVPFEELPYAYNPEKEYVASANTKTVGDDYPYHIGSWYSMPYRMNRINDLLKEGDGFTPESMKTVQTDIRSDKAATYIDEVLQAISERENDLGQIEKEVFEKFQHWDYQMKASSVAALVFEDIYIGLLELVFADEMGDSLFNEYIESSKLPKVAMFNIWEQADSPWWDDIYTEDVEKRNDQVFQAFRQSVKKWEEKFGNNIADWEWGLIHQLTLDHPLGSVAILDMAFGLNKGPFPIGGSYHTIKPYSYDFDDPYFANHGASQRHIYDLADWDNSWTVIPTGISGIPGSPYYGNQVNLYINNNYHRDYFSKENVMASAKHVQNYLPEVE